MIKSIFDEEEIRTRIQNFYSLWGNAGKRASKGIILLRSVMHHPSGKIEALFYTTNEQIGEKFVEIVKNHFGDSIIKHNSDKKWAFAVLSDAEHLKELLLIARKRKMISKKTYAESLRMIIDNLNYLIIDVLLRPGKEIDFSYFYTVD